jgi:hypothetical protein
MELKEEKPMFLKVFLIVLIVLLINIGYVMYTSKNLSSNLTGFAISESLSNSFYSLSPLARIFMIGQWVVLLSVLLFAGIRDLRMHKNKSESIDFHIEINADKNKTDLDTLYEIIKENQELPISAISKSFNITKEIAMEWCKILESGELVTISYPGFSEPLIRINNIETKNISAEKSSLIKDSIKIKKEIEEKKEITDNREEMSNIT